MPHRSRHLLGRGTFRGEDLVRGEVGADSCGDSTATRDQASSCVETATHESTFESFTPGESLCGAANTAEDRTSCIPRNGDHRSAATEPLHALADGCSDGARFFDAEGVERGGLPAAVG